MVDKMLDDAVRRDQEVVAVIHGHGTGALKKAVREHLGQLPFVRKLRPGLPKEGRRRSDGRVGRGVRWRDMSPSAGPRIAGVALALAASPVLAAPPPLQAGDLAGESRSLLRDVDRTRTAVAGEADAAAVVANPANMSFLQGARRG
jgi:hypothetical protein